MSEVSGKAWDTALFKRVMQYAKPYKLTFTITGIYQSQKSQRLALAFKIYV